MGMTEAQIKFNSLLNTITDGTVTISSGSLFLLLGSRTEEVALLLTGWKQCCRYWKPCLSRSLSTVASKNSLGGTLRRLADFVGLYDVFRWGCGSASEFVPRRKIPLNPYPYVLPTVRGVPSDCSSSFFLFVPVSFISSFATGDQALHLAQLKRR